MYEVYYLHFTAAPLRPKTSSVGSNLDYFEVCAQQTWWFLVDFTAQLGYLAEADFLSQSIAATTVIVSPKFVLTIYYSW